LTAHAPSEITAEAEIKARVSFQYWQHQILSKRGSNQRKHTWVVEANACASCSRAWRRGALEVWSINSEFLSLRVIAGHVFIHAQKSHTILSISSRAWQSEREGTKGHKRAWFSPKGSSTRIPYLGSDSCLECYYSLHFASDNSCLECHVTWQASRPMQVNWSTEILSISDWIHALEDLEHRNRQWFISSVTAENHARFFP
jgi:hypothetical protein